MSKTLAGMTPEDARDDLIHLDDFEVGDVYKTCRHALEAITAMTVEEDWRLVSTEQNGGLYEQERWTRLVSEWVADE